MLLPKFKFCMQILAKNIGFSIVTFLSRIVSGSIIYIILARFMSVNDFVDADNSKRLFNLIT
tara:strand:+ start:4514 stop:4699 length:186 start_codon:yes stop_codon:yes gene_type:complete